MIACVLVVVIGFVIGIGLVVSSLSDGIGWCLAWTAFELMDAMLAAITQLARELDPDRLVDTNSGGKASDLHTGSVSVNHSYPYPGNLQPSSTQ